MDFVELLHGRHLDGLQDSVDEELEMSDSSYSSVSIMSGSYRENVRDTWSDLPQQGFGGFKSDFRDLDSTFLTNIDDVSVIFRESLKISSSDLRERFDPRNALEEAVSNFLIMKNFFVNNK